MTSNGISSLLSPSYLHVMWKFFSTKEPRQEHAPNPEALASPPIASSTGVNVLSYLIEPRDCENTCIPIFLKFQVLFEVLNTVDVSPGHNRPPNEHVAAPS